MLLYSISIIHCMEHRTVPYVRTLYETPHLPTHPSHPYSIPIPYGIPYGIPRSKSRNGAIMPLHCLCNVHSQHPARSTQQHPSQHPLRSTISSVLTCIINNQDLPIPIWASHATALLPECFSDRTVQYGHSNKGCNSTFNSTVYRTIDKAGKIVDARVRVIVLLSYRP